MNLVVFGTSLLWGQGLNDADKMHTILARLWQERLPPDEVTIHFLAHLGASTGYLEDGSIDTHREPATHGEVPKLYPTIVQEIEAFDGLGTAPGSVDVILLDAGINDVHITKMLNPITRLDDGLFDVYLIKPVGLMLQVGSHSKPRSRTVQLGRVQNISITTRQPLPIHIDGELVLEIDSKARQIKVAVLPGALRIVLPSLCEVEDKPS